MIFSFIKHPLLRFIVTFFLFFVLFYYSTIFYAGITSQGGYYVPFLDHYFNFINWYRIILLESAHHLTNLLGFPSYLSDNHHLQVINGNSVQIVYSCLGFGLIGLWFAFLIAYPSAINKKIKWALIGFLLISILNIVRIAVLAIMATKLHRSDLEIHHTIYNAVVYLFIIIMIYFFTREKIKKGNQQ